ncbi:hypothetical protein DFJ58DRAFT_668604, partial [Suillus subalutaceus]|uniref:uncharacterized protein n=1 Tax=Suillus subalutaceus TaxID=48586 RepID=UPI001B868CA5
HKVIQHRKYAVPWSNHIWHFDRHHKLILWGISMDLLMVLSNKMLFFYITDLLNSLNFRL